MTLSLAGRDSLSPERFQSSYRAISARFAKNQTKRSNDLHSARLPLSEKSEMAKEMSEKSKKKTKMRTLTCSVWCCDRRRQTASTNTKNITNSHAWKTNKQFSFDLSPLNDNNKHKNKSKRGKQKQKTQILYSRQADCPENRRLFFPKKTLALHLAENTNNLMWMNKKSAVSTFMRLGNPLSLAHCRQLVEILVQLVFFCCCCCGLSFREQFFRGSTESAGDCFSIFCTRVRMHNEWPMILLEGEEEEEEAAMTFM